MSKVDDEDAYVRLGYVSIDTGKLLVTDPGFVLSKHFPLQSTADTQLVFKSGLEAAVIARKGIGNGQAGVYEVRTGGQMVGLYIDLDGSLEDEDDDDESDEDDSDDGDEDDDDAEEETP